MRRVCCPPPSSNGATGELRHPPVDLALASQAHHCQVWMTRLGIRNHRPELVPGVDRPPDDVIGIGEEVEQRPHSTTQDGPAVTASTSVSKVGRRVHPSPWNRPSISVWGMPVAAVIRLARVVLPAPVMPATAMRLGDQVTRSSAPSIRQS